MASQAQTSGRFGPRGEFSRGSREVELLAELATRAWQPVAEYGQLMADPVFWGWGVPRGDGHPVLVLPGLLGGDSYLRTLRSWLRRVGYSTVKSGIERNPGWSQELVQELAEIAENAHRRSGKQVTIVGHSMGGLQGRSIATRRPHVVGHVITLGSPLRLSRTPLPASIRHSALYSREDRIVRYPGGLAPDAHAENIEVPGSHIGLAFNPAVYRQLGRLLPATQTTML